MLSSRHRLIFSLITRSRTSLRMSSQPVLPVALGADFSQPQAAAACEVQQELLLRLQLWKEIAQEV